MGRRLLDFYREAEHKGGLTAKIKLAYITRMPSTQAESEPDSPEMIARFEQALKSLDIDQHAPATGIRPSLPSETSIQEGDRLRRHILIFLDLLSQRSLLLGNVEKTVARIVEAASSALQVERVSVWFYNDLHTAIRCADLFDRKTGKHSHGIELKAVDFPGYFRALKYERTIAAHDAHNDPRTAAFSAPYLRPLGINSMLDVPIWLEGRMVGVICHEHTGPRRQWNSDEETFGYLMAQLVSLAMETRRAQQNPRPT